MYYTYMENLNRYNDIMALVDAWAEDHAGWDCRGEAEEEVTFILGGDEYADWTDEMVADAGIAAWELAE
jgi:hypothetical protein